MVSHQGCTCRLFFGDKNSFCLLLTEKINSTHLNGNVLLQSFKTSQVQGNYGCVINFI